MIADAAITLLMLSLPFLPLMTSMPAA